MQKPFLLHKGSGIQRTYGGRDSKQEEDMSSAMAQREIKGRIIRCFPLLEKQDPTALIDHGRMLGEARTLAIPAQGQF